MNITPTSSQSPAPAMPQTFMLNHMKILQKAFAFAKAFDYISAPRQTNGVTRNGEVSEWLKEHAWKVCIQEIVSRVRIPPSPPYSKNTSP
jgi:hypothetical protein